MKKQPKNITNKKTLERNNTITTLFKALPKNFFKHFFEKEVEPKELITKNGINQNKYQPPIHKVGDIYIDLIQSRQGNYLGLSADKTSSTTVKVFFDKDNNITGFIAPHKTGVPPTHITKYNGVGYVHMYDKYDKDLNLESIILEFGGEKYVGTYDKEKETFTFDCYGAKIVCDKNLNMQTITKNNIFVKDDGCLSYVNTEKNRISEVDYLSIQEINTKIKIIYNKKDKKMEIFIDGKLLDFTKLFDDYAINQNAAQIIEFEKKASIMKNIQRIAEYYRDSNELKQLIEKYRYLQQYSQQDNECKYFRYYYTSYYCKYMAIDIYNIIKNDKNLIRSFNLDKFGYYDNLEGDKIIKQQAKKFFKTIKRSLFFNRQKQFVLKNKVKNEILNFLTQEQKYKTVREIESGLKKEHTRDLKEDLNYIDYINKRKKNNKQVADLLEKKLVTEQWNNINLVLFNINYQQLDEPNREMYERYDREANNIHEINTPKINSKKIIQDRIQARFNALPKEFFKEFFKLDEKPKPQQSYKPEPRTMIVKDDYNEYDDVRVQIYVILEKDNSLTFEQRRNGCLEFKVRAFFDESNGMKLTNVIRNKNSFDESHINYIYDKDLNLKSSTLEVDGENYEGKYDQETETFTFEYYGEKIVCDKYLRIQEIDLYHDVFDHNRYDHNENSLIYGASQGEPIILNFNKYGEIISAKINKEEPEKAEKIEKAEKEEKLSNYAQEKYGRNGSIENGSIEIILKERKKKLITSNMEKYIFKAIEDMRHDAISDKKVKNFLEKNNLYSFGGTEIAKISMQIYDDIIHNNKEVIEKFNLDKIDLNIKNGDPISKDFFNKFVNKKSLFFFRQSQHIDKLKDIGKFASKQKEIYRYWNRFSSKPKENKKRPIIKNKATIKKPKNRTTIRENPYIHNIVKYITNARSEYCHNDLKIPKLKKTLEEHLEKQLSNKNTEQNIKELFKCCNEHKAYLDFNGSRRDKKLFSNGYEKINKIVQYKNENDLTKALENI